MGCHSVASLKVYPRYIPDYCSCELGFIKSREFLYCQISKHTGDALQWQDCDVSGEVVWPGVHWQCGQQRRNFPVQTPYIPAPIWTRRFRNIKKSCDATAKIGPRHTHARTHARARAHTHAHTRTIRDSLERDLSPSQEDATNATQQTQDTEIHALNEIGTHDPSNKRP